MKKETSLIVRQQTSRTGEVFEGSKNFGGYYE